MKRRTRKIGILGLVSLLAYGGICMVGGYDDEAVSALSFKSHNRVDFTFNPTVTVNISSGNLTIANLVPGGVASDSNVIDITVATNTENGFTLTSTVGNNTTAYNSTSLKNGNFSFSPVASLTNTLASIDNNKWGYNYSTDSGTTWAGYDALPLYNESGAQLYDTNSAASQTVKFKIGAKAGSNQASGEYTNVINFIAVTKVVEEGIGCNPSGTTIATNSSTDIKCMQDISSTNKSSILTSMTEDAQYQLTDNRDNKTYYIAKLKDGNIWMTQNLDFDIVDGGANLNSANTDVPANWADAGELTDTYDEEYTTWEGSYTTPESYDPGNLYWSGTPGNDTMSSTGDAHYHLGNYYNWTAAVAMANSGSYTSEGVNQSICPAGWTLPKDDGGNNTNSGTYYNLVSQYGWSDSTYTLDGYTMWGSPLYFPLSGAYWDGTIEYVGSSGSYWSSVVGDSNDAYLLSFADNGYVSPDYYDYRDYGISVRCVAR